MTRKEEDKKAKQEFLKKLGVYIKKLRKEKDVSGAELARRLDMDKPNITRLEKGRVNPSIYFIKKICDALDISMEEFFKNL